jgi:hypothetical protein
MVANNSFINPAFEGLEPRLFMSSTPLPVVGGWENLNVGVGAIDISGSIVKIGGDDTWDIYRVMVSAGLCPDGYALSGLEGTWEALNGGVLAAGGSAITYKTYTSNATITLNQLEVNFGNIISGTFSLVIGVDGYTSLAGTWYTGGPDQMLRNSEPAPGEILEVDRNILATVYVTPGGAFQFDGIVNRLQLGVQNSNETLPLFFSNVPEPATMSMLGLGALALIRRRRA